MLNRLKFSEILQKLVDCWCFILDNYTELHVCLMFTYSNTFSTYVNRQERSISQVWFGNELRKNSIYKGPWLLSQGYFFFCWLPIFTIIIGVSCRLVCPIVPVPPVIVKISSDDEPWISSELKEINRKRKIDFSENYESDPWTKLDAIFTDKCEIAKER